MIFRTTDEAGRPSRFFTLLAGLAIACTMSCDSCDSGGSGGGGTRSGGGGGGGTSSWLVGEGGLMLAIAEGGRLNGYPLKTTADLRAIACWGTARAWVVGNDGLVLTTEDTGATWRAVDAGVKTRLQAVATAEKGVVFIAGEGGVFRMTSDAGQSWRAISGAPADAVWTSIAAHHDGSRALATTAGGDIYAFDGTSGALSRVATAPTGGALFSVALSYDGSSAAAVGDHGAMLISSDGGQSWRDRPSGTTRALHDVWLGGADGSQLAAVGEGGVLIRGATSAMDGVTPRSLGDALTLRALHLQATGGGAIVGDKGTVLVTADFGATWSSLPTSDARDVFAVDALGEDDEHY